MEGIIMYKTINSKRGLARIANVLRKSADLLRDNGWTQGTYARNVEGYTCASSDKEAQTFCALGAIMKMCGDRPFAVKDSSYPFFLLDVAKIGFSSYLRNKYKVGNVPEFNDMGSTKKGDVIRALDRAAKAIESKKIEIKVFA